MAEISLVMRDTFQYGPALSGSRFIRLIKLSPAWNTSSPLHISLKTSGVGKSASYECLSYTWDGQISDRSICCDGKLMLVTMNVEAAMRRLRREHRPRWLWIDAICINQVCTEEKNAQVSMMADIYINAKRVLVWLGTSTSDIEKAVAYCRRAIHMPLKPSKFADLPTPPEGKKWKGLMQQFCPPRNVEWMLKEDGFLSVERGLDQIIRHRYWSRIWTVQEVAFSRRTKLYIGDCRSISFEELIYGYDVHEYYPDGNSLIYNRDRSRMSLRFHMECANRVKNKAVLDPPPMVEIAASLFGKRSSNPRDKCFAIKAMYPDLLGNVEVSYERNVADVYIELAGSLFHQVWGTNQLGWMLDITSMCLPKSLNLPSWVPDWSSEETAWLDYQFLIQRATYGSKAAGMLSANKHKLYLLGKVVDTVHELVGPPFPDWSARAVTIEPALEVEKALRNTHRTLASLQISSCYKNLADQFDNLISTMIMGRCLEGVQRYLLRGAEDDGSPHNSLFDEDLTNDSTNPTSPRKALDPPNDKLSCRTVFLTRSGRVGLGRVVQPGDELVLFAGTDHPYVVRRSPLRAEYELRAPAIVEGMMTGDLWSSVKDDLEYICLI